MSNIPKIIHYIWLGDSPLPKLYEECIKSWLTFAGDWTFKLWNNENLPTDNLYLKKALQDKKYAFASDYLRCYVLKEFGGVYLDVDIELVGTLNDMLHHNAFLGLEKTQRFNNAVMGSMPDHWFVNKMLNYYDSNIGVYRAIPKITTELIGDFSESESVMRKDDLAIYPPRYFYPFNPYDENSLCQLMFKSITPDTVAIHHWGKNWKISKWDTLKNYLLKSYQRFFQ